MTRNRYLSRLVAAAVVVLVGAASFSAAAEIFDVPINKTKVLRLKRPATYILVGNPEIADISVETSRLIFVHGRTIGETNLLLLDSRHREIANYDLIVVPTGETYITIQRGTTIDTMSCDPRCAGIPTPGTTTTSVAPAGGGDGGEGNRDTGLSEEDGDENKGVRIPLN